MLPSMAFNERAAHWGPSPPLKCRPRRRLNRHPNDVDVSDRGDSTTLITQIPAYLLRTFCPECASGRQHCTRTVRPYARTRHLKATIRRQFNVDFVRFEVPSVDSPVATCARIQSAEVDATALSSCCHQLQAVGQPMFAIASTLLPGDATELDARC